jgi:hypothetical protein
MIETTAFKVFNSGLNIQLYNKTIQDNLIWDNKIFWQHVEPNRRKIIYKCDNNGFFNLNDCLEDCLKYITKSKSNGNN